MTRIKMGFEKKLPINFGGKNFFFFAFFLFKIRQFHLSRETVYIGHFYLGCGGLVCDTRGKWGKMGLERRSRQWSCHHVAESVF